MGKNKILKVVNVFWGQLINAAIILASIRIYTELLPTTEFGLAMIYNTGFALCDSLIVSAFTQSLIHFCSGVKVNDEHNKIAMVLFKKITKYILYVCVLIGVILFSLYFIFNGWQKNLFILFVVFSLYLPLELFKSSIIIPMNIRQSYFEFSFWQCLEAIIVTSSTILFLMYISKDALIFIFSIVIGKLVFVTLLAMKNVKRNFLKDDASNIIRLRDYFNVSIPFSVMGLLGWGGSYLDRYSLAMANTTSSVGIYVASSGLINRPFSIASSILTNYFRPILYKNSADNSTKKIMTQWISASIVIGIISLICIEFLGDWLIGIFLAKEYRVGATSIMFILSIGLTAMLVNHALDNFIFSKGKAKIIIIPQLINIVITVFVIYMLATRYGGVGAAYGKCISDVSKLFITAVVIKFFYHKKGIAL